MKSKSLKKCLILFLLFSLFCSLNAEEWVISSMQFTVLNNKNSSITKGLTQTLPQKILKFFMSPKMRNIQEDEIIQRKLYELKNRRISLFLQLSAEIKTRDSFVINQKDEKELKKQIKKSEEKIIEIKNQIEENLAEQKNVLQGVFTQEKQYDDFLSNKLQTVQTQTNLEKITIYNNTVDYLYPSNENFSLDSYEFEKEMVQNKINCLITGDVNLYQNYFTVNVNLTNYPGAKTIACVTEYGNINDLDDVAKNIYLQIKEQISNMTACNVKISGLEKEAKIYLDNDVQTNVDSLLISPGIHTLEFMQEGYKTCSTTYFFEANKEYNIEVKLKEDFSLDGKIKIDTLIQGSLYANSIKLNKTEEDDYVIKINNQKILSQFISEEGNSFFFYINPLNNQKPEYTIKLKNTNTNNYIDKRRRWMYTSYSIFVCSLFPKFYLQGKVNSYTTAYSSGTLTDAKDLIDANKWINASNISTGVSIGAGVFFVYELIRYLYAANSVLPTEAKMQ